MVWDLKVDARSLQALLPDNRPHTLSMAAAFSNLQHWGSLTPSFALIRPGREGQTQIIVRSRVVTMKWTGAKWEADVEIWE